jgi:hypothetical protein
MYVFLDAFLIAWAAQFLGVLNPRRWRSLRGTTDAGRTSWAVTARTAGLGCILLMAGVMYLWGQLATQTANNALTEFDSAISGLLHSNGSRSNDILYGFLPAKAPSQQALLNEYRKMVIKERSTSPDKYIPASIVAQYPTPPVDQPLLPLTRAGRLLSYVGIPPTVFNSVVRGLAAKSEQTFIIVGLLTLLLVRSRRSQVSREIWFLCIGNLGALILITLLPNLSVGYGILRTFQQALLLAAPVLVAGSLAIFSPLGATLATRATVAFCMCIFASTTGLLPQLLGGYPAQLALNNSGLYYDIYYVHPQEVAAVTWLFDKPAVLPDGLHASFMADRFAFNSVYDVTGKQVISDIYPWSIQKSNWVFLSYSTVHTDMATIYPSTGGDLITYLYPISFLWNTKNLVYNNGGAEIYR